MTIEECHLIEHRNYADDGEAMTDWFFGYNPIDRYQDVSTMLIEDDTMVGVDDAG